MATTPKIFMMQGLLPTTLRPTMRNHDDRSSSNRTNRAVNGTRLKRFAPMSAAGGQRSLVIAGPAAEDHQHWSSALQPAFEVREVTDRRALDLVMAEVAPSVLVVDLALTGLRRTRGLRDVRRLSPSTKVIAVTDALSDNEGMLALKAGVSGYCARTIRPAELLKAVTVVQEGEIWASRRLVRGLISELVSLVERRRKDGVEPAPDPRLACLTARQRVVAQMISHGASNKEIGNRLNITERTVKAHLTETFRHVGVTDRLQLALLLQGHSYGIGDD